MDFSIFKKHPAITIGVGLLAAFVFYEIALSGGSSGGQVISTGPSDASVQASAQLSGQAAGYQAQAQQTQNTIDYNLKSQAQTDATNLTIANLNAATSTVQQTNAISGQLSLAGINFSSHQDDNTTALAGLKDNNQTSKDLATIGSNTQIQLSNIVANTGLSYANIAGNTNIQLAGIQSGTVLGLANIQGAVTNNQINASRDVSIASIDAGRHSSNNNLLTAGASLLAALL